MNYTQHYQLPQWVDSDRILRTDFNDSYQKLDSALDSIQSEMDANAQSTTAALATKGNCHLYTTSYTGTGQVGASGACVLTFPAKPIFFFVREMSSAFWIAEFYGCTYVRTCVPQGGALFCKATWSGNTVSWYDESNSTNQMNKSGSVYQVFAFLETGGES